MNDPARSSAPPRARAPCATTAGPRTAEALEQPGVAAGHAVRMKILIATDAFPPVCGGSGWSTYELARGLRARGHAVDVVQPRPGTARGGLARRSTTASGPRVRRGAPAVPYVRNYFKNERLYPRLADFLAALIARERFDIVHAQHVLTCLPAIEAARAGARARRSHRARLLAGLLLVGSDSHERRVSLCPACSAGMMTRCIRPRGGALWPLALPMIPYMRANLARKRSGLARADAVIAVSSTIAPTCAHARRSWRRRGSRSFRTR